MASRVVRSGKLATRAAASNARLYLVHMGYLRLAARP